MSDKTITPARDTHAGGDWQARTEVAPSVLVGDEPMVARMIGLAGAFLVIVFGGAPLLLTMTGRVSPLGPGLASLALAVGIACLLFHAAFDWDVQFRRIYMLFGYLVILVSVVLALVPYPSKVGDQFGKAAPCMLLGLFFLLAFLRNETDDVLRRWAQNVIGIVGAIMAVVGVVGSNIKDDFLVPIGLLLTLLGLVYLTAFVGSRGTGDDRSYRVGQGIGVAGVVIFLVALGRSLWASWIRTPSLHYHVPTGLLLMFLGVLFVLVSFGLCSDRPFVVMTRRELGAYFFSPIAYITIAACIVAEWLAYVLVTIDLLESKQTHYEPIFRNFILQWPTVLYAICIVPVITMRAVSEEKRSGTMEVLLTAPVNEPSVVLSKFLAAFLFYLLTWVPFGLLLIALRIEGGKPFDYRPLMSFFVGLCFTGAGFISMGLFFSSLTRNQIISGILSLVGMVMLTMLFLLNRVIQIFQGPESPWVTLLNHVSYLNIWIDTVDGKLMPRLLLFYLSMTIVWLFLSVKVLEARKWT
jgi:ABC-type transport system involved in multi-copper enzyme maturation permease subunit